MKLRALLIVTGLAVVAFGIVTGLASLGPKLHEPGNLVPEQAEVEWRCPPPGDMARKPGFELVNVGGTPVRITSVRSGCGCANAQAEPLVVPPRGKTTVLVDVEPIDAGVRFVTIVVETDSPTSPSVPLRLSADGWRRPP